MVRDAETKQAIAAAEVRLSHPCIQAFDESVDSSEKTGTDGVARLSARPNGKDSLLIEASAKGYRHENQVVSDSAIEEIEPAGFFQSYDGRAANFVLEMYADPPFAVELTIPRDFRGLVRAKIQIREDLPHQTGQRTFQFSAGASGVAYVVGPPQLRRVPPASFAARYDDGALLGNNMDATRVGFRWIKHEGTDEVYVVGTQSEYEAFRHQLFPDDPSAPMTSSPQKSRSGRGGGGGHRGGGRMGGNGGSYP